MDSSSALAARGEGLYGYTSAQAAQAAALADLMSLKCKTGYIFLGLQEGEAVCTPIRVMCTLVTVSVASAWFGRRKSIKMLLLFFCHWLSGLLHQLATMIEATMLTACWAGDNLVELIKALKFLELSASNMLAITNLAICVNLALIVKSNRTLSRVKSVSSPMLMVASLVISVVAAAGSAWFWDGVLVTGTTFWVYNESQREEDWITASLFCVEFFVGISMLLIVVWLLIFRMEEIKECWKLHARIRYYFGLTLIGTAVNLALGICGTVYVFSEGGLELLIVLTWSFRYIHIALDTFVLYGVLGSNNMDERAGGSSGTAGATTVTPRQSKSSRGPKWYRPTRRSGRSLLNFPKVSPNSSESPLSPSPATNRVETV